MSRIEIKTQSENQPSQMIAYCDYSPNCSSKYKVKPQDNGTPNGFEEAL